MMPDIEALIEEFFSRNYEMLRLEGGHNITQSTKNDALNQVIIYWRKMKDLAEKVTETEVKLTLPGQRTKSGREFTIQGIVDIVQENDEISMYDIKTHDLDTINNDMEFYEKQLNIYAYIWQNLRGQKLDKTAIISTALPQGLKEAFGKPNLAMIDRIIREWNPTIDIELDESHVESTINDFAEVVDKIESGEFTPAPIEKLKKRINNTNRLFATHVCRNCDARYSCSTFREYALDTVKGNKAKFKKYFEDYAADFDQEDWINNNF